MAQNYVCDDLSHRNKRQKTNHPTENAAELSGSAPALTDEQWLSVLKMIWSGSTPLVASSLNYCVSVRGLNWMLQQAKAAIAVQTAHAVYHGLILKGGLSESGFRLYYHIQEDFGLIPQPTYDVYLKNPF